MVVEIMELRGLFPNSCQQTGPLVPEPHINGNRKSITTLSTFTNVGSDNCGSVPSVQNNLRLSRGFYTRLPPLCKSGQSSGLNVTIESKQQRESENKLNALFDQYKVNFNYRLQLFFIHFHYNMLIFPMCQYFKYQ